MSWQNSQGRLDQSYCRAWVISEIKEISGCFPAPAEYSSSHFGGPAPVGTGKLRIWAALWETAGKEKRRHPSEILIGKNISMQISA